MAGVCCAQGTRVLVLIAVISSPAIFVSGCGMHDRVDIAPQAMDAHDVELASSRVAQRVPTDMFENAAIVLYFDKAANGPLGQHMVVFQKGAGGLAPLYAWPVSTGREDIEADAHGRPETTVTPEGIYPLDPKRIYESHESSEWGEAMPYAMFLANQSAAYGGLAIHAATGDGVDHIGKRASAGCIRLAPENARTLFDLVRSQMADAAVPDQGRKRNSGGHNRRTKAIPVVVVIDDYPSQALASLDARH